MASENIKLNKPNFTVSNGYFYMFDKDQDNLLQKTDDGNTAFTYPFDTLLTNEIISTDFDGVYFWSMEDPGGGDNMTIRRWKIDNYICKLQDTHALVSDGSHDYNSEAFSVEHYHTSLSSPASGGATTLYLNAYSGSSTISGSTLHLGPNTSGQEEDVTVVSGGGYVTLASGTQYAYASSDEVNYFTNIWLFNDVDGKDAANGALYKFDAWTGSYITKYPGAAYSDVGCATFYNIDVFSAFGAVDSLCYVKGTNILFVDIDEQVSGDLRYYGSMVMENIKDDEATVIEIYAMAIDQDNIYRLQLIEDGGSGAWSNYSYLLSPLDAFVTSISLSATPAIIAANGLSTSSILATVKDQFFEPIVGRNVTFSENGTGSIIERRITDYIGSSKTMTVDYDFEFPIEVGDTVRIYLGAYSTATTDAQTTEIATAVTDAVWDEAEKDHVDAGSFGKKVHDWRGLER